MPVHAAGRWWERGRVTGFVPFCCACSGFCGGEPSPPAAMWISWGSGSGHFQWSHLDQRFSDSGERVRVNHLLW